MSTNTNEIPELTVEERLDIALKTIEYKDAALRGRDDRIRSLERANESCRRWRHIYNALELRIATVSRNHHDPCWEDPKGSTKGAYPFIPLNLEYFQWNLELARRLTLVVDNHRRTRSEKYYFLDVGAGVGTKVHAAQELLDWYWLAEGIEIDPHTQSQAQWYTGGYNTAGRVMLGDGRTFADYKRYNIIYMYCPMANKKLQSVLEKAAYDGAQDGAILMQFLKQNHKRAEQPHLHSVRNDDRCHNGKVAHGPVFIKTTDTKLLAKVRQVTDAYYESY